MKVYFSDFFEIEPKVLEKYGAFNVSLINDLPLFIDPFLLFNSNARKYKRLHRQILEYVAYLRDRSNSPRRIGEGTLRGLYCFPEVKQTWLGFSKIGNSGRGPGMEFAKALDSNLRGVFSDFDRQKVSRSPHLEKLCLIKDNIGRDSISDFVTNLIKGHLLAYTEVFAKKRIDRKRLKKFRVARVAFNFKTGTWISKVFELPVFRGDFVLLTPKDILTKDDTWISKSDLYNQFDEIVASVPNSQLRDQLSTYFSSNLPKPAKNKDGSEKKLLQRDLARAIGKVIFKYPEFLDYYVRFKENDGDHATSISGEKVERVRKQFVLELSKFIERLSKETEFYDEPGNTLQHSYDRVLFLKNVIENKDGYRVFYVDGNPIRRESDLQTMFRLTWYASADDVSPEANAGRGPVDFKISKGAQDKTLVEFKLASNSQLAKNLEAQVEIYKKAHDTKKSIKAILYFTAEEKDRVERILRSLRLDREKYVILIDARNDNKPSASKAKAA